MTKLKSLLLGTAGALLLSSGAAVAADQPQAPQRTPVWACDITGFWELPGTDICFKVGGYAKADLILTFDEFNANPGGLAAGGSGSEFLDTVFGLVGIARGGAGTLGNGDEARIHARQSRVNFDARTNTSYGTVRAFIEGDFFGTGGNETISNSSALRLRHAFVQFGNLLAGQTWGTFMNLPALYDTLDFGGAGAVSFIRQAQFRWTQPLGNGVSLVVAIENPENMDIRNVALRTSVNDEVPDFVAKLVVAQAWGHIELAGVLRDMQGGQVAGAANLPLMPAGTVLEDEVGWAVSFSGRIKLPVANGKDDIRFNAIYSDGGTRYLLNAALMGLANGGTEGAREWNNAGQLLESYGVSAGFRHFWSDNLRSNLIGSVTVLDNVLIGTSVEETHTVFANLIWSPVPRVDMGIEFIWSELELLNGTSADLSRLQVSVSRSF